MRIAALGAAFSAGGAHPGCRHGPKDFRDHEFQRWRRQLHLPLRWSGIVRESTALPLRAPQGAGTLARDSRRLMRHTRRLRRGGCLPLVIGGDHSCAIGTWSGIANAQRQPLGLLWIDAHLDSHTPETSESQRLHGMPLAVLLGQGDPRLTGLSPQAPIDPRFCAVIGVRSFEAGEPLLLRRLGVRFYARSEIHRRGLGVILAEAWRRVAAAPGGFGVSLDLDVLDPLLAPGVSVPERRGLQPRRLARLLRQQPHKQRLRGLELVELNPQRDPRGQTRRLLPTLLTSLLLNR
ncbi:MAG TPA: arginase family protein [Moraxellaceae bacterium]